MIKVNDRVVLTQECVDYFIESFDEEFLKEVGVDIRNFGEGTVISIRPQEFETWKTIEEGWISQFSATVEWDNPQTIPFDDEPDRLCNEIAVEWLEKVESDA